MVWDRSLRNSEFGPCPALQPLLITTTITIMIVTVTSTTITIALLLIRILLVIIIMMIMMITTILSNSTCSKVANRGRPASPKRGSRWQNSTSSRGNRSFSLPAQLGGLVVRATHVRAYDDGETVMF